MLKEIMETFFFVAPLVSILEKFDCMPNFWILHIT